jgi:hypothetical protein
LKASNAARWVGIALAAAVIIAAAGIPSYYLTVTVEEGTRLWAAPIAPGTPVTLAYENSIYRAPTEEILVATAEGFTLRTVRSTSEAVLAYNGLEAPYRRNGIWFEAQAPRTLPRLTVRIGRTGRQHLLVAGRTVPLYDAGEGARVQVDVMRAPRVVAALRAWTLR